VLTYFKVKQVQLHLTIISLLSCFIAPLMKFAASTLNRAFGLKEEHDLLAETFGRDSGLSDVFYCHGMVGLMVAIYL